MRLVRQRHQRGCASACLAMLTGKTYYQVLNYLHPKRKRNKRGYDVAIGHKEFFYALSKYGFKPELDWVADITKLEVPAVLAVHLSEVDNNLHAVLWDSKEKRILDPNRAQPLSIDHYQDGLKLLFRLQ